MSTPLERLQMRMRGELPMHPVATLLGLKFTSAQPGEIVMEYTVNDGHKAVDAAHAGVICTIAKSVMTTAYGSTLGEGERTTLIEFKVNFIKPAREGQLRATGKLLKGGRTIGLVECDILDDRQELVARAVGTCIKLESS